MGRTRDLFKEGSIIATFHSSLLLKPGATCCIFTGSKRALASVAAVAAASVAASVVSRQARSRAARPAGGSAAHSGALAFSLAIVASISASLVGGMGTNPAGAGQRSRAWRRLTVTVTAASVPVQRGLQGA